MKHIVCITSLLLFTSLLPAQFTDIVNLAKEREKEDSNCSLGDCQNGWGVLTTEDGTTYAGTFYNGKVDGIATVTYKDGRGYQGEFKNGKREGAGIFVWFDGEAYLGGWKNGAHYGRGILKTIDGKQKAGIYVDDKLVDPLDEDYQNGKDVGNCSGDCEFGYGLLGYADGSVYGGFFNNGERYAMGIHSDATTGDSYIGSYKADKRDGFGILTQANGDTYMGMFKEGQIQGLGIKTIEATGEKQMGVFNSLGKRIKGYERPSKN